MNITNKTKIFSVGRRKTSIATTVLIPKVNMEIKSLFKINGRFADEYFQYNFNYLNTIENPIRKLELLNHYDIVVSVKGGGLTGQVDAIKLALARSLCKLDKENFRAPLKSEGFLSRDARIKERRKYGLKKARKASQSSKR
jgi:small subunit ribosomal protein S9|uniref:Small ribosomal subunit protein uS9c n=1 Tax=Vaucheria litorea TaxID=109269 RepID=B7T1W1_VAULI|nr:ribosomal protein S9 [Vaucheria litorea]ACF70927.1 ribosomal protein S9 [Vaucheria litorea]